MFIASDSLVQVIQQFSEATCNNAHQLRVKYIKTSSTYQAATTPPRSYSPLTVLLAMVAAAAAVPCQEAGGHWAGHGTIAYRSVVKGDVKPSLRSNLRSLHA
jgi:hypothetical protein